MPRFHQGRERRALAGAGHLERQHRLVALDRRQHDAAAAADQVTDLGESAGRQGLGRPRHFLEHRGRKLGAEAQGLLGDDDRLRRDRRPGVDLARPHIGLVVKPGLGDKDGEQAENDGKPDHDDSAGTHCLKRPEYFLHVSGGTLMGEEVSNY